MLIICYLIILLHWLNKKIDNTLSKMDSGEFKDRHFSYSYRIAKAAQKMLSICLHNELNSKGIHVSTIHLG
jgi:NAD(P)-dependent dehydrogenase (short-subunit alcohol dehydrogenase family)